MYTLIQKLNIRNIFYVKKNVRIIGSSWNFGVPLIRMLGVFQSIMHLFNKNVRIYFSIVIHLYTNVHNL